MIAQLYYKELTNVLEKINGTQTSKILNAAGMVSDTIMKDGIIYIFGCGHSHLIALDSFYRAGGLANVSAMLDTDLMLHNGAAKSSVMEKVSGIAAAVFQRYCVTENDILIIVSTSGKNAVPVEMAQCASNKGIKTIGVVSSDYFNDTPLHESGRLLHHSVDIYIDNCVPHGDATVQIAGCGAKMGSVSTAASSFIVQSVILEASAKSAAKGKLLPVYMSGNVEGGAEFNRKLIEQYLPRIKHL